MVVYVIIVFRRTMHVHNQGCSIFPFALFFLVAYFWGFPWIVTFNTWPPLNSFWKAEDRAHRRGQSNAVNIYIFCAKVSFLSKEMLLVVKTFMSLLYAYKDFCYIAGHFGRNTLAKFKQEFASCLIYYGWKIWCSSRNFGITSYLFLHSNPSTLNTSRQAQFTLIDIIMGLSQWSELFKLNPCYTFFCKSNFNFDFFQWLEIYCHAAMYKNLWSYYFAWADWTSLSPDTCKAKQIYFMQII